jgi:hypothetical protein
MTLEIQVLSYLGQAQKCCYVKPINGIPTLPLLIIGYPMLLQIKKIMIKTCTGSLFKETCNTVNNEQKLYATQRK